MGPNTRRILADFLKAALKPLAGFCLRRGLKIQEFEECAKAAFVDAATEELRKDGHELSQSRLSVMIGLHRRDVARLTAQPETDKSEGLMMMRLIGQWQHDKRFSLHKGVGRPLTFEGMSSEFVDLVQTVSKDLNPYTILFELERLGIVHRRADRIELIGDTFESRDDPREGLRMLALDIYELTRGVEENVYGIGEGEPNLHSRTTFNNIICEAIPEIRRWLLTQGATFHERARAYLARFDKDLNPDLANKPGGMSVSLGTFSRTAESTRELPSVPVANSRTQRQRGKK